MCRLIIALLGSSPCCRTCCACPCVLQDMLRLSSRLDTVDEQIEEKSRKLAVTPRGGEGEGRLQEEMERLRQGRARISAEYSALSAKMNDGELLSAIEERGYSIHAQFAPVLIEEIKKLNGF